MNFRSSTKQTRQCRDNTENFLVVGMRNFEKTNLLSGQQQSQKARFQNDKNHTGINKKLMLKDSNTNCNNKPPLWHHSLTTRFVPLENKALLQALLGQAFISAHKALVVCKDIIANSVNCYFQTGRLIKYSYDKTVSNEFILFI